MRRAGVTLLALAIFVSGPLAAGRLLDQIDAIFKFENPAITDFFEDYARSSGVKTVRHYRADEMPKTKIHPLQLNCGAGLRGEVLIDTTRKTCVTMMYLAHETTHIYQNKRGCRGHGPKFYAALTRIAKKFESRFPGVKWDGRTPSAAVAKQAQEYQTPETCN